MVARSATGPFEPDTDHSGEGKQQAMPGGVASFSGEPSRVALQAMKPTNVSALTLALFAGFTAAAASAQTALAPDTGSEPVAIAPLRVTADLWETPLARIPASVSVFDDAALRAGATRHFGDLVEQIPNLTWTGGTSRPRYLQIRGVGENSQYEGETPDSAVRFLVDDLDFTGLGSIASTFDVSQVEVLRGPQAGAFGANAAGGLVRLVTNAPTPFWNGQTEVTVGEDSLLSGGFAVGGPLIAAKPEQLMMRLAVQQSESDGFRRNVTLNRDTNARDEFNARLRLTWNPGPLWRWDATLVAADLDNGFDDFALDNNGERTFSDRPGRDEQCSLAASVRGTYRATDDLRFSTITSVARTRSTYSYDDDWTAASYEGFSDLRRERRVLNQELRLDSTPKANEGWLSRWTLGGFYSDTDEDSTYRNEDPGNIRGLTSTYRATNAALFGQVGHDFSARTRLIAGLRVEQIELEGDGTKTRFRSGPGIFDAPVTIRPDFSDTLAGGKVSLEHDLTAQQLIFASVTRGYKGGGVNIDARINPATDPLVYATETLWNYEAGLRGNWFEQRLTTEATVFYLQRDDPQVRDSAGFGGSYRFFTDNGESADVYGLEAASSFVLTRRWSLRGALALMNSELEKFTLSNGNLGGGRDLANTPHYGYTIGTRYGGERGFFAGAELIGRAEQFDSNNQNEARRSFQIVNASIGYAWREWTFTLWAKNVFDETYDKRVFFFGNEDPNYIETRYESRADPRQVGVTGIYRF